jgi:hypothetical protein
VFEHDGLRSCTGRAAFYVSFITYIDDDATAPHRGLPPFVSNGNQTFPSTLSSEETSFVNHRDMRSAAQCAGGKSLKNSHSTVI